jgi:TPR repeat protein
MHSSLRISEKPHQLMIASLAVTFITLAITKYLLSAERHYQAGMSYTKDPKFLDKAIEHLQIAATKDHLKAQCELGALLIDRVYQERISTYNPSDDLKNRMEQAMRYLEVAAKKGCSKAQLKLGVLLLESSHSLNADEIKENRKKGIEYLKNAADQGDAEALYLLAICYETGQGVEADHKKAIEHYQKAADHEHPNAQYIIAKHFLILYITSCPDITLRRLYDSSDIFRALKSTSQSPDILQAIQYLKKAAEQGHSEALLDLGVYYKTCLKQSSLAQSYYYRAAYKGHPIAQSYLGDNFYYIKDYKTAFLWYKKAALQNVLEAQNSIRRMFENKQAQLIQDFSHQDPWLENLENIIFTDSNSI